MIPPIKPNDPVSFGYSHPLKTLWKKGQLPTVKYGFYGDELTLKNISVEHLQPKSLGGKTSFDNIVLASRQKNNARGVKPILEFVTIDTIKQYLLQFLNINIKGFDGNKYIKNVMKTLENENIKLF